MPPSALIGIAALIATLGLIVLWWKRSAARRGLMTRESLDDDAVYSRFYAGSGLPNGQVLQLWHEIAETLGVPSGRLRPEDRFGKNVGTYWITSDALDVLAAKGRQRAKQLGLTIDLKQIATVDQYVRCFARNPLSPQ
jgi:hypothetical protein